MTDINADALGKIIDSIVNKDTVIVGDPQTITQLSSRGLPIKNTFIPYEQYVENLLSKKREQALDLVKQLPQLDKSISDAVLSEIYSDIRDSYTLGIFTAAITNSIFLLEYALRSRLFREKLLTNPKAKWNTLEKITMGPLVWKLNKLKVVDDDARENLLGFTRNLRNPYLHINIHRLSEGVVIAKLPKVDVKTGEVTIMTDVRASQHRFLWFSAKRFFDKNMVSGVISYCVNWSNKLLVGNNPTNLR